MTGSWNELNDAVNYYTESLGGVPQLYSAMFTQALGMSDVTAVSCTDIYLPVLLLGFTSLVRRIKAKNLWRGSLLYAVIKFTGRVMEARTVTVRAGIISLAFLFVQWMAILVRSGPAVLLALLADIAAWFVLSSAWRKVR